MAGVEKKKFQAVIYFNATQWRWFCQEMLGLAEGQEPAYGQVAEFFKTGGSLLGIPEDNAAGAKQKAERTKQRDYLRDKKREERARKPK